MTTIFYNRGPTANYLPSPPRPTNPRAKKEVRFALPAQTPVKQPADPVKPSKTSQSRRSSTRDHTAREARLKPSEKTKSTVAPVLVAAGLSYIARSLDAKRAKTRAPRTPTKERWRPPPAASTPPRTPRRVVVVRSSGKDQASEPGKGSRGGSDQPKVTHVYRRMVEEWY